MLLVQLSARLAFQDVYQERQEIRGETAIGDTVIHRQRELGNRSHMNAAIQSDNAVALAPHGENGRLRRIDEGIETIRSARPQVGEADRCALQFILLQRARQCTFDDCAAPARQLGEPELFNAMQNGHE